jgi:protein-S-isoprenylcysteine O-methyltransferase Ste14
MQSNRVKSYMLVIVQFACLLLIAFTGPILAGSPLWLVVEISALALAVWALLVVRIGNINITPDVRQGSQLVRSGPYRWLRHPIYAALLLGALALVIDTPTWWRAAIWIVLLVDLLIKLHYEEQMLVAHFPDYVVYMQASKRLIPYVY